MLPEAAGMLLLEVHNETGLILTILHVKIDSGAKIEPGLRRWHIDKDPGYDLAQFGLNLTRTFLECVIFACKQRTQIIYQNC